MKINGKTLNQHWSAANRRANWLKKLQRLLRKHLSQIGKHFTLDQRSLKPPTSGPARITLVYTGAATDDDTFAAHVRVIENCMDCRFANNVATVTSGRATLEITLQHNFQPADRDAAPTEEPTAVMPPIVVKARRVKQAA